MIPGFFKVTDVKSSKRRRYGHVSLLFDLEHSNLVYLGTIYSA
jgi:hypothetical protein